MSMVGDAFISIKDSLFNLVTGLGTAKDPRSSTHFYYRELDRNRLEQMYRSDWLARRLVDLPAEDATREWRSWNGDAKTLEKIDQLERKLEVQKKVRMGLIRARLYGGGALVMGINQGQPDEELDFDKVGLGDFKFLVVVNRYELMAGPRIYNVDSPWYTRPEYYTVATPMFGFFGEAGGSYPTNVSGAGLMGNWPQAQAPQPLLPDKNRQTQPADYGMVRMHPSRIIEFAGNELPDWRLAPMGGGWGDSILQTVEDSLKDFSMIMGGLASMINDMKMDVVKIPELSRKLSTADLTTKTMQRFGLANMAKSSINTLLLDKDEDWERINTSFGSTPELIKTSMTVACAAGGVPESRVMGNAPSHGLQGTGTTGGEQDVRNYYDDIASQQKSKYKPMLLPLDVCLQRSATGKFDPSIDYKWNPLYQPNPQEKAATALAKAQTTQVYVTSGLINEDALREATVSQLIQDEIYPGLEDAIDEFGAEPEEPPAPQMPLPPNPPPGMMPKGQFDPNPFHMLRAQAAAKAGQPIRVPPNRPQGPPKYGPVPPGAQPSGKGPMGKAKDAWLDDFDPDQPRDDSGKWTSGGGGSSGGTGNYGLVPGDAEKFRALKDQWAQVNNGLLAYIDKPDSPEAQAKLDQLESLVKQMHGLHADPGTAAGIGLPGGPRDVTIVGAGPGGLAAGIFGGAEGLDTLVVDANTVAGGQAKFSSRIENFPGFPIGVTGAKLTQDMLDQAGRVGAETKLGARVTDLSYDPATGMKHLTLSTGERIDTRAVILAGGVEFRRPTFPGADGSGVVVGDGKTLTEQSAGGDAVVVGGSNGAAQAALGAATKANHVTLLSRSPLSNSMSDYQISALHNHPKITVVENDGVAEVTRDSAGGLTSVRTVKGQTVPAKALGMFLGSVPETDWLAGSGVQRDKAGKIQTKANLETNIPGVFAVGDMRVGAIGRVGVAVGEGQLALRESHVYLGGLREKESAAHVGDADAADMTGLITRLFALDRANPWFGQTVEGVKPPRPKKRIRDFNPNHDEQGRFASGEGDFDPRGMVPHVGMAEVASASKAAHDFVTSPPVRRGIATVVAGMALETTASVAHESTMHALHKGVEGALDYSLGVVTAHLLGHAGLIAAGGAASAVAPFAIAVVAGVAVHKLAGHAGITEENSRKVLAATGHFLIDHFHALYHAGESSPMAGMVDAEGEDPLVLQALKLLVPHWEQRE